MIRFLLYFALASWALAALYKKANTKSQSCGNQLERKSVSTIHCALLCKGDNKNEFYYEDGKCYCGKLCDDTKEIWKEVNEKGSILILFCLI